jgi:hypothetical protein
MKSRMNDLYSSSNGLKARKRSSVDTVNVDPDMKGLPSKGITRFVTEQEQEGYL